MTPDEIKNAQREGFSLGRPAKSGGSVEPWRTTLRKAVDIVLWCAVFLFLLLAAILLWKGNEIAAHASLFYCVLYWIVIHERRHIREKETRATTNVALGIAGIMGGVLGWALHGHADPKCPVCGGAGRVGNDIPCPRCAEDDKVDEPPKEGKPS